MKAGEELQIGNEIYIIEKIEPNGDIVIRAKENKYD